MTLQDGQVITQTFTFTLWFGCTTELTLNTARTTQVGDQIYVINTNDADSITDWSTYFLPADLGCLPTYEVYYGSTGTNPLPDWLNFSSEIADPTDPLSAYSPVNTFWFDEGNDFTNVGDHNLRLKITLQDGTVLFKPLVLSLDFGCTENIVMTGATTQSLGTFNVAVDATEAWSSFE